MTEIIISDHPSRNRYEVQIDGKLAGFLEYHRAGNVIELPHTMVFQKFRGKHIAEKLIRYSLDHIRATGGLTINPSCPYVKNWIEHNLDYADLVQPNYHISPEKT